MKIIEKHGLKMNVRENTQDEYMLNEIFRGGIGGDYRQMILTPEDRVLDLGGNIGIYALANSNRVKEIVSFEPDKENKEIYNKNMVDNNITNCKVMPYAVVGNDDKERKFYLSVKKNLGAHTLIKTRGRKEIIVPCMNINTILKEGNFNKIKMDIEGAEYEVLRGIESFSGIESIAIEFHVNILGREKYLQIIDLIKYHYNNIKYNNTGRTDIPEGNWALIICCSELIEENKNKKFEIKEIVDKVSLFDF